MRPLQRGFLKVKRGCERCALNDSIYQSINFFSHARGRNSCNGLCWFQADWFIGDNWTHCGWNKPLIRLAAAFHACTWTFSRGIITQFRLISHRLLRIARLSNSFACRFGVTVLALISEHNCLDDKWTFETATELPNYSALLLPALSWRFRLRRGGKREMSFHPLAANCDRLWSRNHFLSLLFFFSPRRCRD